MMIKFPVVAQSSKGNGNVTTKYIISPGSIKRSSFGSSLVTLDGARMIGQSVSVNELGKQLLKAAEDGDVEEVRLLLSKGALFTANWLGVSPLHLAAKNNHLDICEVLLRSGISKDARTKVDRTSLHEAACEGHLGIVNILLEYGVDPDSRDMLGMTPLHWAVQWGHTEIVRTLLKHGAQTDYLNKFNLTPEQIAIQIDRADILELLRTELMQPNPLAEQLGDDSNESHLHALDRSPSDSPIPLETVLLEDSDSSPELEKISTNQTAQSIVESQDNSFAESIKFLQQRGITLLPDDDHGNILTTVMQTGHSVVLTDVGKQVLNSIRETEQTTVVPEITKTTETSTSRYITVTPEEFLAMTSNCVAANKSNTNVLRQVNGKLVPKVIKKVVMKKQKVMPVANLNNAIKVSKPTNDSIGSSANSGIDIKTVMKELVAARKTIEEMKQKLRKKEEEAERYKKQLKLLMDAS